MEVKRHWLGQRWYLPGAAGNDINKASHLSTAEPNLYINWFGFDIRQTNVPNIRLAFRHQTLLEELNMIREGEPSAVPSPFAAGYASWTTDADAHVYAAEAMVGDIA